MRNLIDLTRSWGSTRIKCPTLLSQSITFRAETAFNHHRFKSKIMTAERLITNAAMTFIRNGLINAYRFPDRNRDFSDKKRLVKRASAQTTGTKSALRNTHRIITGEVMYIFDESFFLLRK